MLDKLIFDLQEKAKEFWPDFQYIYKTLYSNSTDKDLIAVIETINLFYVERKTSLKQIDEIRVNNKNWHLDQKWIATMFYTDLYTGNIKAIENRLDYLKDLGINYIHLMPLLETREGQADGGYAIKDFRRVNPKLGSNEDLINLIEKMHEEDQIIAIDFVMNHTAKEHNWAQSVLRGESQYANYYYIFSDRNIPDQFEKTLPEVFPDFAPGNFTYQPEINKWVWTTFNDYQWDLNYSEPAVFNAMLGEMLFLANLGVDILRLDAVPFLWKKLGTNCQNQEEAVLLLVAYKYLINLVAPGVLFKSEAIVSPNDIIRYLGSGGYEGKACEIGYNATLMNHLWHAIACENTHLLRTTLSKLPKIPASSTWINYIRCHDDIGWGISDQNAADVGQNGHETRLFCSNFYTGNLPNSYAQGYFFQIDKMNGESRISGSTAALIGLQKALIENKKEEVFFAINRFRLLHGIIFFMKGIPLVYAGDEIGHLNNFDYLKDETKKEDNRWLHRPKMDWDKAELRLKSGTIENMLFNVIANLAKKRKKLSCLHGNAEENLIILKNDKVFCVKKIINNKNLVLLANFSREYQWIEKIDIPIFIQILNYKDEINGCNISFPGDSIILPPYGIYWLSDNYDFKVESKIYTLNIDVSTFPGESVYIIENNLTLLRGEKPRQLSCYWKDGVGWLVEIEQKKGSFFSYNWVKMYGNEKIEVSKIQFFFPT